MPGIRVAVSVDRSQITRARQNVDNMREFWRAVQLRQVRRSKETFYRLRSGGTYRGASWNSPTKQSPPSGTPYVNRDTLRMFRAIKPSQIRRTSLFWEAGISCRVEYAKYRNRVAPFLFWSAREQRQINRELAAWMTGGPLPRAR